jgi:ribose transport system permease protein
MAARTARPDWRGRLLSAPYSSPAIVAAIVLLIITAIVNPGFISRGGWERAVASAAPFILLAMAAAPAIISGRGGVDLSVGPAAGLIAVVIATVIAPRGYTSPLYLIPAAILMGLAMGAANGLLIAYGRIPPIIATLGTYLVFAGIATQILPSPGGTVPPWLRAFMGSTGPIPTMVVVYLAVAVLWILLMATAFRRNLFAVGGNDRAALTAGVNVELVRLCAYSLTGALAGISGLVLVAVLGGADPTVGPPYTLVAIAGVALGGVSLLGGRGGLLGPAAGGATLFLIQNLLSFVQVSAFLLQIVYGIVVLVAIMLNGAWEILRRRQRAEVLMVVGEHQA